MAYGIISQHRGWINVYSEPGKGSVFKIYLPATAAGPGKIAAQPSITELRGSGQRVLVVEDAEGIRSFIKQILSKNGYRVFEAATARKAREVFERENGQFGLLYSDVVLPDGSGFDLARKLVSLMPGLPVLMTSGYTDQKAHLSNIKLEGFDFLQKPASLAEILKAVNAALKRQP